LSACRRCAARSAGHADVPTGSPPRRGYDHDKYRRELRARRIKPEIARRQTAHGSGLGRVRWVVERTFAWLHNYKRLLVRYDRRHEIHEAFLALACCLVCFRRLQPSF
jgi:transposase